MIVRSLLLSSRLSTLVSVAVVWQSTTQVACAASACPAGTIADMDSILYVCQYTPPGNVIGQVRPLTVSVELRLPRTQADQTGNLSFQCTVQRERRCEEEQALCRGGRELGCLRSSLASCMAGGDQGLQESSGADRWQVACVGCTILELVLKHSNYKFLISLSLALRICADLLIWHNLLFLHFFLGHLFELAALSLLVSVNWPVSLM